MTTPTNIKNSSQLKCRFVILVSKFGEKNFFHQQPEEKQKGVMRKNKDMKKKVKKKSSFKYQAQAPTNAINPAPATTAAQASTLLLPLSTPYDRSLKKSSASNSTSPAKSNNPLLTAFIIPTINKPASPAGSYRLCTTNPIACPNGVVVPYASAISHGFGLEGGNIEWGMAAMREPRARPSKVW